MLRSLVSPGFMSPVSPTFLPAASSSIRSVSPSKDAIGKAPAWVSVFSTTNSCVRAPGLDTLKVVFPAVTVSALSLMNMCVGSVSPRVTETGAAA